MTRTLHQVTLDFYEALYVTIETSRIKPKQQKITRGEHASFACVTTKRMFWSFNDGPLPLNSYPGLQGISISVENYRDNRILYIENITRANQGYYECEGATRINEIFFSRAFLSVESKQYNYNYRYF